MIAGPMDGVLAAKARRRSKLNLDAEKMLLPDGRVCEYRFDRGLVEIGNNDGFLRLGSGHRCRRQFLWSGILCLDRPRQNRDNHECEDRAHLLNPFSKNRRAPKNDMPLGADDK
ncbi:MAG: hypothetical protein K8T89_05465 [Planctomycetes bacterium]|nr:hypothetical protein [Planctomycetota bacterium]